MAKRCTPDDSRAALLVKACLLCQAFTAHPRDGHRGLELGIVYTPKWSAVR